MMTILAPPLCLPPAVGGTADATRRSRTTTARGKLDAIAQYIAEGKQLQLAYFISHVCLTTRHLWGPVVLTQVE